jgi:hypothetical protein
MTCDAIRSELQAHLAGAGRPSDPNLYRDPRLCQAERAGSKLVRDTAHLVVRSGKLLTFQIDL